MSSHDKSRLRSALLNLSLVLAALVLSAGGIELALRLTPNAWRQAYDSGRTNATNLAYRALDDGLYTLAPGQTARFQRDCYDTLPVTTNAQGFRGPEWEKRGGVFLLGDSFVEALQVGDGETMASQLSKILGEPVYNAGVSGYSTATELFAYDKFLSPMKPRLVLLAFFLGNDVTGNSCRLDPGRVLCGRKSADAAVFAPERAKADKESIGIPAEGAAVADTAFTAPLKRWLRRNFVIYYVLHDLKIVTMGLTNQFLGGGVRDDWRIYLDRPQVDIDEAWDFTTQALSRLKAQVESDGGRLVLISIPEALALNPDWRRAAVLGGGSEVPSDFNPRLPSRRLSEVANQLNLEVIDLLPKFETYRDIHGLTPPFFSFACDGHWNPLGHYLAAHHVANEIWRLGLVDSRPLEATTHAPADPQTILGRKAFEEIYRGGVYHSSLSSPLGAVEHKQ